MLRPMSVTILSPGPAGRIWIPPRLCPHPGPLPSDGSIWLACSNREAYGVPPLGGEVCDLRSALRRCSARRLKAGLHTLRDSNTLTRYRLGEGEDAPALP